MTRAEVAGWLQLLVALVGLYLAVTNGGAALEAIGQVGAGQGLPSEFKGAQGAIRVFIFIVILITLLALFFVGLAIVLGGLFRHLGAIMPLHSAFALIAAIVLGSAGLTLAIFGNYIWIPLIFLAGVCAVCSGIAAYDETKEIYWPLGLVGGVAVVLFGIIITAFASNPTTPAPTDAAVDTASAARVSAASAAKSADGE